MVKIKTSASLKSYKLQLESCLYTCDKINVVNVLLTNLLHGKIFTCTHTFSAYIGSFQVGCNIGVGVGVGVGVPIKGTVTPTPTKNTNNNTGVYIQT